MFVLDSQSTDDTVAVAQRLGATVEVRAWSGYVEARRYALSRVDTAWALMLDADEVLDAELCAAIERAPGDVDAYRLRRITSLCGKAVRTAGWSDERLVRLFRTDRVRLEAHSVGGGADLHERWIPAGASADLEGAILHDSYPTLASYRVKFDRYTSLEAAGLRGSPAALARTVPKSIARFAWWIVKYRGWLDGWRGLVVAGYSAAYPIVVQWKALRGK
ncbi:MAG: glycosyltransferase family 2 protein [Candidatus Velthaea sp.]